MRVERHVSGQFNVHVFTCKCNTYAKVSIKYVCGGLCNIYDIKNFRKVRNWQHVSNNPK